MRHIIQEARKEGGLTQADAAQRMFLGVRQYQRLEYGEQEMSPQEVVRLAEILNCHTLTMLYCRNNCAVGRQYSYAVLNNVDRSPQNILLKLYQVYQDAGEAIRCLLSTVINKQERSDFTDGEGQGLTRAMHDLFDLEHTIETLKIELGERQWCDIPQLVSEHNSKCYDRGYVTHGVVREVAQIYAYGDAG